MNVNDLLDSFMKRGITYPKGNQTLLIHDIANKSADRENTTEAL